MNSSERLSAMMSRLGLVAMVPGRGARRRQPRLLPSDPAAVNGIDVLRGLLEGKSDAAAG